MSDDQCDGFGERPCDSSHCGSGGLHCDGDVTQPDTTTAKPDACPVAAVYEENGLNLHWQCVDSSGQSVNIYENDVKSVASGTVCTAHHRLF